MTRSHIALDDLGIMTIAVKIPALRENLEIAEVFPYLYEHGLAIVVDSKGFLVRMISNVILDNDNPMLVDSQMDCLPDYATVREARDLFDNSFQKLVPLLDEYSRYTGYCASRNEMLQLWTGQFQMPRLGGLATPLGVYLTTGVHSAGTGTYGLVLTGVIFAVFVMGARLGFQYLSLSFSSIRELNDAAQIAVVFFLLLLIIRLSPLSGLHAAEHQVIHTIELGIPLTPENVLAQPKAHRRCGTNIMVALVGVEMAYLGVNFIQPIEYGMIFLVVWLTLLIMGWQHLGMLIQMMFTTTRPNQKQVDCAIKAGKDLIDQFRMRPHGNPKIWQRVWGSGMLQIFSSFIFTSWLFEQVLDIWFKRL